MWYLVLVTALRLAGHTFLIDHHHYPAPAPAHYEAPWELVKNEAGIAVYDREIAGKDYREYKGVTRFKTSLAGVVSLLQDIRSYPSWLYTCRQARILKTIGPGEQYLHFVYDVPVYANRDAVMHSCATRRSDGNGVTMKFGRVELSSTGEFFKEARLNRDDDNEYVKELSVTWQLARVGNEVEVTYSIYLDPDIGFPGSLRVNATTEGLIFESLKKMGTKLTEPAYRDAAAKVIDALPVRASCF